MDFKIKDIESIDFLKDAKTAVDYTMYLLAKKHFFIAECEIIEDIIHRMSHHSFLIRGWAVTIIVGALLLNMGAYKIFVAFLPLVAFWYLDAFFLRQERLYRHLYAWVVKNRLKSDEFILDMNAYRFKDKVESNVKIMFSHTLLWFYGSIAFIIIAYFVVLLLAGEVSSAGSAGAHLPGIGH
jgi:uncharacterized membrane protein YbaN (DUF454 family)